MNEYTTSFSVLATSSPREAARRRLADKLTQMADLPDGWSHGEGVAVSWLAIDAAQRYITLAAQLDLAADVFPNLEGGCAVAFYRGDRLVEVSISADGQRLSLKAEQGMGYDFVNVIEPIENASSRAVYDQILSLMDTELWKSFEPSTYASTDQKSVASETWSTRTPRPQRMGLLQTAVGGFQSLMSPVPVRR